MPRNKPNKWQKSFKNSPRSSNTQERELGVWVNDDGNVEPIDVEWKTIGKEGVTVDQGKDVALGTGVTLSSPSANNLTVTASGTTTVNGALTVEGTFQPDNIAVDNGGNIGSAGDADAMSIAADGQVTFSQNQNHSGQQIVNSQTVNDLQSGASFKFDGSSVSNNHSVSVSGSTVTGDSARTISGWVRYSGNSATTDPIVFSLGADTTSNGSFAVSIKTDGSEFNIYGLGGANDETAITGASSVMDGEWHYLSVTYSPSTTAPIISIYVDGVLICTRTRSAGEVYNTVDGFVIGDWVNSDRPFDGEIRQVRLHNRALTAAEVRASYNGQAVPFEYTGASQAELVADGDMSNASTWTAQTGWTINGDSSGVAESTGTEGIVYIHPNSSILTNGKRYRVSLKATRTSGPGVTVSYYNGTSYVPVLTYEGAGPETVTADFTPINSTGFLYIQSGILGNETAWAGEVDDVSLTQIGCVAEYLPTGISATKWINSSGTSGLDGTVTSATAINHEVGTITATGVVEVNNGIKFPATQVSSADPNTLDDYEVGTCTLTIQDAQTSPSNIASLGSFDYARIGDIVTLNGRAYNIDISEFTLFAPLYIVGFPYAGTTSRDMSGYFVGADTEDVGFNWVSTTAISLVKIDSTNHNTANLLESNCPGNISVSIFGSYKATT